MIKQYSKIYLVLIPLLTLACNLLSTPQQGVNVPDTEAVATIVPTLAEMPSYIRTGTYATKTYDNGAVCTLEIKGEPDQQFYLNCNRGAPSYNQGMMSSQFQVLEANVGNFKTDAFGVCELRFDFTETGVDVTQTGADYECGFGAGVTATGSYTYQNEQTPNIP